MMIREIPAIDLRQSAKILAIGVVLVVLGSRVAQAQDCWVVPSSEPRRFPCTSEWINFFWNAYDFDRGDWDEGFGYYAACDTTKPLARTFNGIEMVNYASPSTPASTDDFSGNILQWGGNYTMRELDELDARCGDGSATATTVWGPIVDNYTELYLPFFFEDNAVSRAADLIHEARHADWCDHSGNDGDIRCPAGGGSCDECYRGCDACDGFGSPSGLGANGYEVLWLWWYLVDADSRHINPDLRELARDHANRVLNTKFDQSPCFNITEFGGAFQFC